MHVKACDKCGKLNTEGLLYRVAHKKRVYDVNRDEFTDGFSVVREDSTVLMPMPYDDLCHNCVRQALEAYLG